MFAKNVLVEKAKKYIHLLVWMHRISSRLDNPAFFNIRLDTRFPCWISGKTGYRISG
jgi:hypothetical protein